MSNHTLQGIITAVAFIAFIALCVWVFAPKNRRQMEENGRIPLDIASPDKESSHE